MDTLWSAVWGRLGARLIWGIRGCAFPPRWHRDLASGIPSPLAAGEMHSTPITGIVLALAGCAFPPRSPRGPLQHKTGCWRTLFLYPPPPLCKQSLQRSLGDTKKPDDFHHPVFCCGEGGIRTPGSSQINGFQDRRNRPLCHLSFRFGIANVGIILFYAKINCLKCEKSFSARDSSICVQGPKSTVSLSLSSCQGRFLSFW